MNIGIDGNEANVDNLVGTSVYTHELLHRFADNASQDVQFTVYVRETPRSSMPDQNEHFTYKVVRSPRLWRDVFFPLHLYLHQDIDVLFAPAHYTPRFCPVPIVVTLHDISYEYFPGEFLQKDLFKLREWTKHAVKQSEKVISVSKNTEKDAMNYYNLSKSRSVVIHNGFQKRSTSDDIIDSEVLDKYSLTKDQYLLFVGTLQPRKNLTRLIEAFEDIHSKHPELKLCVAGKKGWMFNDIFETVQKYNLEDAVKFGGFVPDEELPVLYKNALLFVLPGLYEGFGMPLLEAMSNGTACAASDTGSLPEIGSDACAYFDPHDTIEVTRVVLDLIEHPKKRMKLEKKGLQRVKKFSWDTCAEKTLDILKHVAKNTT